MSVKVPPADSAPGVGWGPRAFYGGVVKSTPFEARFERIHVTREASGASSEEKVTGAIYRDSAGRVRREYRTQVSTGEALELAVIVDLPARAAVALDFAAKAATRFIDFGPAPGDVLSEGWAFMGPWSNEAEAGQRIIEGVACRKMRPEVWPLGSALSMIMLVGTLALVAVATRRVDLQRLIE